MIDEVGLRGAWFLGKVIRMTPNEAFVELDDLLTENGQYSKSCQFYMYISRLSRLPVDFVFQYLLKRVRKSA